MTFEEDIKSAVACLRSGGVILYPTDTVWGIGCDATNPEAVKKIFELKQRAEGKSMLALVDGEAMLERTVEEVPEVAWQLIEAAVEPLTIIYDNAKGVAPGVCAPDGSLGVRITSERYSSELCRRLRRPIVSTSANLSGKSTPCAFDDIADEVKNSVDYVAAYRRDDKSRHKASNIIKVQRGGVIKVIR